MDFYNSLLAQKLSGGGGGGGDKYAAFKALVDDSLTEVTAEMLDGITKIGDAAFSECRNLTSVTIPNSVTLIERNAFRTCDKLESVTIPNSVTSIGDSAFAYCDVLENMTIPGNTSIGTLAFSTCYKFSSLTMLSTTPPGFGVAVFQSINPLPTIYVPAESVDAYKSASGWSYYANQIQAIPSD